MANTAYQAASSAEDFDALFEDDDGQDGTETPINQSFMDDAAGELAALMTEGGGEGINLEQLNQEEVGGGEKAADAIDFGDLSNDDLPDEEDAVVAQGGPVQPPQGMLSGITDIAMELDGVAESGDYDDLFDDDNTGIPDLSDEQVSFPNTAQSQDALANARTDRDSDLASENDDEEPKQLAIPTPAETNDADEELWRMQALLFRQSGKEAPTNEQENLDEWLKLEFPFFKRTENPYWNRLLPVKPGKWTGKTPLKPPRPIRPSKVNLELEHDQKAAFSMSGATSKTAKGLVRIEAPKPVQELEQPSDDSEDDEPLPGGISMQELDFICTDFDTLSSLADSEADAVYHQTRILDGNTEMFGFDDFDNFEHPIKKRRLDVSAHDIVTSHQADMPSFDDPERMTASLASRVLLDMNDRELLVEEVDPEVARARVRPGEKVGRTKTLKDRLGDRFKTSNDAEYDLLKQNHQSKVRGQLGNMGVDHAAPAIRLQYPYYQVKRSTQELRNHHRTRMLFKHGITFSKPEKRKRKHLKNMNPKEIYSKTKELSIADNSTAILLEYSEEHPVMLSQVGMGNKLVNYYRRQHKDDTTRPKLDIGETSVLLPEDKSPFYSFGHVDPGETVTALYNSMYRAPIYAQDAKPQEFLLVRETTGLHGQQYYLRTVDHIYTVGQELPSVTVPGTHSRMVTTASKNRLKSISYRIARRKKSHRIRVEDVTKHFPDTSDMQNRQKMKEFMVFSKEHKEWEMKPGEPVPDEDTIQGMIRPEDICLLESMQVGAQYLQDAGYGENDDEDDDMDKEAETDSIEQQLAPWKTTKNFIQATQGKAMLKLYGEGDPSGRGEAFSFIKTSMKGGFKALGRSANEVMASKKELGGHSYNVAAQQRSYEDSIRNIWDKQKKTLSSKEEPTNLDMEGDVDTQEERFDRRTDIRATPASSFAPTPSRRRDDETATSFSKRSVTSQGQKYLLVKRTVYDRDGNPTVQDHIETDAAVIKQYLKVKEVLEVNSTKYVILQNTYVATNPPQFDRGSAHRRRRLRQPSKETASPILPTKILLQQLTNHSRSLEEELARLQKNQARRMQRDKTKQALATGGGDAGSPDGEPATPAGGRQTQATQRKCANCGQVGHIKTNKKSVLDKCRHCGLSLTQKIGSSLMDTLE